jgi:hypothetical protein
LLLAPCSKLLTKSRSDFKSRNDPGSTTKNPAWLRGNLERKTRFTAEQVVAIHNGFHGGEIFSSFLAFARDNGLWSVTWRLGDLAGENPDFCLAREILASVIDSERLEC